MTTYNVYRRNTVSDTSVAIATGLTSKSYSDATAIKGNTYLYSVGAVKNGIEKISAEIITLAGTLWTPQSIAQLWIDSEHLTYDSSNRISIATDISASGYNLSQSTDANKPIKTDNIFNSLPSIRFNGTASAGQWLASTAANALTANKNYLWCFVVMKNNTIVTGKNMGILRAPIGTNEDRGRFTCLSSEASNLGRVSVGFRRLDGDSFFGYLGENISLNKKLLCFERNHTLAISSISIDGVKTSSSASGSIGNTSNTSAITIPFIVGTESTATNYLNGDIACLIFGNNELSLQDRQKLEGWAAHKYQLIGNLPLDHPYKTLAPIAE